MVDLEAVWYRVLKDTSVEHSSIHGPDHWARVERNGLLPKNIEGFLNDTGNN